MKRLWRAIEFLAWAGFFAFAALILALRFWLLPDIERYRPEIVAAVTHTVGQPVAIGGIEAGWLGLRPQIRFSDVRIQDREGREVLVLPRVENVIAWRSLLARRLRLQSLIIDAPRLTVRRDAAGELYVAGMKITGSGGEGGIADWILAQEEIVIRDAEIEWRDDKRGAPPLALSALSLRLKNSGAAHSVGLAARPPAALASAFQVRAELQGESLADLAAWNGRLYAEFGYTDLAAWRAWLDYPLDIWQGQGALRLWARLDRGKLKQATADVALARVVAWLGEDLAPLELASVQGRLQVGLGEGSYELAGRNFALVPEQGAPLPPADFRASWTPAAAGAEAFGAVTASAIDLQALGQLAAALPLPADLRQLHGELGPRGRLADTRVEWRGSLAEPNRLFARSRFSDLALRARGARPGFAGLSGTVEATEAKGTVVLSARKGRVELPGVFPDPSLAFDSLNGRIEWERQGGGGLALRVSSMSFANEHLSGNAYGSYSYPGAGRGAIDLSAQFNRADARFAARYLPLPEIMGAATRDWLARAIVAGQASDVRLRLKGELADFPFTDPSKGQFQVAARVEKGVLDYAPGWPRIHDIDAELLFERDRLDIVGRSGAILGTRLANVHVGIPKLARGAQLLVSGQADGDTGEFLKYVAQSPVRGMVKGAVDGMAASGRGKLRLKLELPLAELRASKVAGEYEFSANSVTVSRQLPPVEAAAGRLSFTESGFALHDVRGRVFGGAVAVSGGTRPDSSVEVVAKGDATVAATRALLDHPWRRYLSGSTPYVARIGARDGRLLVSVESSLVGVASTLPPPLAKAAAEALPLRVEVVSADGGARDRVSVALGRLALAEAIRRRQGEAMVAQRTGVWLSPSGEQPVRLPERPGTLVYGRLAALDLDRWAAYLPSGEGAAAGTSLDLKIGALDVSGRRVHQVSVRAGADAAGWAATVSAAELAGDLSYRSAAGGKLTARLAHFRVPDENPGAAQAAGEPRELPAIDFMAERFTYKGRELGRVEFAAQRAGNDWRIERFAVTNPESALSGHGVWSRGSPSRTSVEVKLDVSDAGKFLERGGQPNVVSGGKVQLQAALSWNGDPTALDYPSLNGDLQLQAQDGQFLEIQPGLGKLISLMSLQALPRRITLDFRDVFSKGFQFERIVSSAHLESGVMMLSEFKMRGSAAQVDVGGTVDLANETQDLRVRVVPSLGDSASTVLAFVNPLLVFPAALAQKILKDPLGHIFAFDYAISGSWADPKVEKIGVAARAAEPGSTDR